ncbi:hypothetical protein FACS1894168_0450 [Deltaproteobacteria bacterium]|nr:hypothetical protein FACS1894168_0450 [Deltaproteobacteria bacterium]
MNKRLAPAPIHLLPPDLRNQIAAGEVVERPASVLKELVENSLDAGATDISVCLEQGGITFLEVRDNGLGIAPDELELAVTRHATSKIARFEDLLHVNSFGFRGEALPSIASVAQLRVTSLGQGAADAAFISIRAGMIEEQGPAALRQGTKVTMHDLFVNVPARLKFLKTPAREAKLCEEAFIRLALAHNDAAFTLTAGGNEKLRFYAGESSRQRLSSIWPSGIVESLLAMDFYRDSLRVHGLMGHPQAAQARGDRIFLYVNGRSVKNKLLVQAVREAYRGRLLTGEYPQALVFLELPQEQVDVNVHPAKTDVRFLNERDIFSAVSQAARQALDAALPLAGVVDEKDGEQRSPRPRGFWGSLDDAPIMDKRLSSFSCSPPASEDVPELSAPCGREETVTPYASADPFPHPQTAPRAAPPVQAGDMEYLGQIAKTYLLVRRGESLLIVDQHAMHERVRLHAIEAGGKRGEAQFLALPLLVTLHSAEGEELDKVWEELSGLGFVMRREGSGVLHVTAIPPHLAREEAEGFIHDALGGERDGFAGLWHMMACRSAIKAGQELSANDAANLVRQWLATPNAGYCPHGRPVAITLSGHELEKLFKRKP